MLRRFTFVPLLVSLTACGRSALLTSPTLVVDNPDAEAADAQEEPPSQPAPPPCGTSGEGAVTIASLEVPDSGFPYQGLTVVAQDDSVYWSVRALPDTTQGLVLSVPRCAGPVRTIAPAQDDATTLAVEGQDLYWGTMGDDNSGVSHGAIVRAPLEGGAMTTLVTDTAVYTGTLAVDTAFAYATGWNPILEGAAGAWKVPLTGGTAVAIGPPEQIFTGVAVDASQIYLAQAVTDASMSRILAIPIGGGDPTILVPSGVAAPAKMVLDDASVYYMAVPSTLMQVPKMGGTPTALGNLTLKAMAVDGTDVYWIEGDADAIKRMPKGGGATTTLSTSYASAIAVDDAFVYWLDANGGVVRLAK